MTPPPSVGPRSEEPSRLPPLLADSPPTAVGTDPETPQPVACATARSEAELVREPIDIVALLDNSLSMVDEARSVEATLNVNFASLLEDSGIDYRLILISRHRNNDTLLGATSVCIDPPLGGGGTCPAPEPSFGERFFHYSTEVGSSDSFDVLLDSYDGSRRDDFELAPSGWSTWLRAGTKKVFLEISDDDENMPASTFSASSPRWRRSSLAATRASPASSGTASSGCQRSPIRWRPMHLASPSRTAAASATSPPCSTRVAITRSYRA